MEIGRRPAHIVPVLLPFLIGVFTACSEPSPAILPTALPDVAAPTGVRLTALPTRVQSDLQLATATAEVVAAATSRGPSLEATDPGDVTLVSGGLQLIEFFRFT
jgi:hypothetical protein